MEAFVVWGGIGTLSALTAFVRTPRHVLPTVVLRFAFSLAFVLAGYAALFGLRSTDAMFETALFVMFVSLPVLGLSFLFDLVREAIGTIPYIGLIVAGAAATMGAFLFELNRGV